jgi:hypothetical protein
MAGIVHGLIGIAGLWVLLLALQGSTRGAATGTGSFGMMAAALFAGAVLTGVIILIQRRIGVVTAIHAGMAIAGYVLLLAWNALG